MKFDLKHPCENCPFINEPTRITFACRERAEEIEEQAYRNGFPCHRHAECVESWDGEESGYEFRRDGTTQHCMGAIMMHLSSGGGTVPFENLSEDKQERIHKRLDWDKYKVFENEEEFFAANDI